MLEYIDKQDDPIFNFLGINLDLNNLKEEVKERIEQKKVDEELKGIGYEGEIIEEEDEDYTHQNHVIISDEEEAEILGKDYEHPETSRSIYHVDKELIKQDPQREIVAPRTLTLVQIYAIIERVEEELNLKHQN